MIDTQDSADSLREMLPPGSTVLTLVRHVSKSGMTRHIDVFVPIDGGGVRNISAQVAELLEYKRAADGSLKVGGAGMDMGFHVVYSLSRRLYPDGHHCIGQEPVRCPSNDHSNDYGDLARHYAAEHEDEYNRKWSDDGQETRTAYCAARSEWMATQEAALWSPERIHRDGGYALNQRWL